jgi:serine/threonine-protein kinase
MLTGSFVLPADILIKPVTELPQRLRGSVGAQDGDYALSRRNSRMQSKLVDAQTARLLEQFRRPSSIAVAIARLSRENASDAEHLLEDALTPLLSLIRSGFLVPSDSQAAQRTAMTIETGHQFEGWQVVRPVQTLDDTEVYLVRKSQREFGALKIARTDARATRSRIEHELAMLDQLPPNTGPALCDFGIYESRSYLITEWVAGADLETVCGEFRTDNGASYRRTVRRATGDVLLSYARLHRQGIVHGDVHPHNVLLDRSGAVTLIDFGLSRKVLGSEAVPERGGLAFFFEPELAESITACNPLAATSFLGEQYSIAAMLYLIIVGSHYADFSLQRDVMLEQIVNAPMVPFVERGIDSWPDIEQALRRALSKHRENRFESLEEFADVWISARIPRPKKRIKHALDSKLTRMSQQLLREAGLFGSLLAGRPLPAPSASLTYGSSGLAYAIYRVACARDDPDLFALADIWSETAFREIDTDGAFSNEDLQLGAEAVGPCSLFHGRAGVYAVRALIAAARGDVIVQIAATTAFVGECVKPGRVLDVTLGIAGALLGCSFLLDALPSVSALRGGTETVLRHTGSRLQAEIWNRIDDFGPIGESLELTNLGVAHGWAGLLYSTLCWCAASGTVIPDSARQRLHELAELAEPVRRGLQWKWDTARHSGVVYMPGWCNGSAGFVFLWTAAYNATGEEAYLNLAEGAAWNVWEASSESPSLCCGAAGQVYALLNYYRCSDVHDWLQRARKIANAAANSLQGYRADSSSLEWRRGGLYKGDAALALLSEDLKSPSEARMPMFEREV